MVKGDIRIRFHPYLIRIHPYVPLPLFLFISPSHPLSSIICAVQQHMRPREAGGAEQQQCKRSCGAELRPCEAVVAWGLGSKVEQRRHRGPQRRAEQR